jgi:hypothetical protein
MCRGLANAARINNPAADSGLLTAGTAAGMAEKKKRILSVLL